MQLALRLPAERDARWELARQAGVKHTVLNLPDHPHPWEYGPLSDLVERAERAGLSTEVIEQRPPMDAIRLGRDGRERQIEQVCELVRNLGRLDVPVWCWSWRTHFPVFRTGEMTVRGGSRVTDRKSVV